MNSNDYTFVLYTQYLFMPRGKYIGAKISSPSPLLVGRAGVNLETLNMNCYLLLQIRSLSTHDLSETFFSICDKWC